MLQLVWEAQGTSGPAEEVDTIWTLYLIGRPLKEIKCIMLLFMSFYVDALQYWYSVLYSLKQPAAKQSAFNK